MKKILLFPFNGNAREALSTIEAINRQCPFWTVLGFVDDDPRKKGLSFGNYQVIGGREKIAEHPEAQVLAVPGRPDNFLHRTEIIRSLHLPDTRFATIVHPSVQKGIGCTVGGNTLLMAGVVLTSQVVIGKHVVILPNSVVSHDSKIHDYCLIGSNVSISGSVIIKSNCYIGSGAKIIQETTVGAGALIGLGSVVIHDISSSAKVAGNPAKQLKGLS